MTISPLGKTCEGSADISIWLMIKHSSSNFDHFDDRLPDRVFPRVVASFASTRARPQAL